MWQIFSKVRDSLQYQFLGLYDFGRIFRVSFFLFLLLLLTVDENVGSFHLFLYFILFIASVVKFVKLRWIPKFFLIYVFLLFSLELIGYVSTIYLPNSVEYSRYLFVVVAFVSPFIAYPRIFKLEEVLTAVSLFSFLICLLAILRVFELRWYFVDVLQFQSIYSFRNYLSIFGYSVNNYSTIILISFFTNLLFVWRFRRFSYWFMILLFMNYLALTFTFSRVIFMILMPCLFFLLLSVVHFICRGIYREWVLCLFILYFVLIFPFRYDILQTFHFFGSKSQVDSAMGRIDVWRFTWNLFLERPILGYGSNNFGLLTQVSDGGSVSNVSRTYNLLLHVVVEKGIVGVLVYLFILVHMTLGCFRDIIFARSLSYKVVVLAGIVLVLIKEMTFTSVLHNCISFLLFSLLLLCGVK